MFYCVKDTIKKDLRRTYSMMTIDEMIEKKNQYGYSYEYIAQISGVPASTVQKVLSKITSKPRRATLTALRKVFETEGIRNEEGIGYVSEEAGEYYATYGTGALQRKDGFTVEDIEKMPESQRAELIDGEIYMMSSPSKTHQEVIGEMYFLIKDYFKKKKGSCKVFQAPFAVYLFNDDKNYFEPDISVICDVSKLDEKGCHGAPDWIIEVVSPSSKSMDYVLKPYKYKKAGVREYWVVDAQTKSIWVYDFQNENNQAYSFEDKIKVGIYEDLVIDFKQIDKELLR